MAMAVNAAKARLKRNQLAVGIGVRLVRNVDIIKVMKAAGFDWLFLDLEHGAMSIENACEIATAAQDSGIAPFVRVPYGELAMAARSASSFPMSTPRRRHARLPTSCVTRRSATVRSAAARHSSTMRR